MGDLGGQISEENISSFHLLWRTLESLSGSPPRWLIAWHVFWHQPDGIKDVLINQVLSRTTLLSQTFIADGFTLAQRDTTLFASRFVLCAAFCLWKVVLETDQHGGGVSEISEGLRYISVYVQQLCSLLVTYVSVFSSVSHSACWDVWCAVYMLMRCSCWMMHYNLSRCHRCKPATASPGSSIQTGLSSCTVGCVFVCLFVCNDMQCPPPPFDHSLLSVHRAYWVCACLTHSGLWLYTLLYSLTDRWVSLWLAHRLKQTRKTPAWFYTQTHITRSHWVTDFKAATPLCICLAISWLLSARTVSVDVLKTTGDLLTQMLVVRVCGSNASCTSETSASFQAQLKWVHHKRDTPGSIKEKDSFMSDQDTQTA